ncbi:MAG: Holliday junction branch migration protein RuvA [Oscillospiraceae bacterium]|nr:Holliday junction branch migration protein RuvA [Oscillospiraceae bacterium]MBQ3242071.1 Holliday junction branch migration protein RuvA [Oscillospiraceae bacterium]MBQ7083099.1 Holliday junction branch migration protein RuvA [Oscillospiraceae bacterium]MBR2636594.1 Holliday junction branch migration protein RuvA [Oscillospiraceae bacterium]MBR6607811.1 Holliday junction branch migration protein RuvA [Oscillospiraceae bacterium]
MFYSVRGKLIHIEDGLAVVECAGVGFALKTTNNTLSKLPALQSEVMLYTHFMVREDAMELFGFYDMGELNCFKMMLTVSGVGPKAALAILSQLSPEKFALCVATGDVKSITRAPGVGPKLANRLILELKDKVQNEQIAKGVGMDDIPAPAVLAGANLQEAISALVVLGYSQSEAASALGKLDPELPVEELIRQGLRKIAGGK